MDGIILEDVPSTTREEMDVRRAQGEEKMAPVGTLCAIPSHADACCISRESVQHKQGVSDSLCVTSAWAGLWHDILVQAHPMAVSQ